jgi:Cyclin, N-terminal domain
MARGRMEELKVDGITAEEEKKILLYYQVKLLEMCKYLDLQLPISSTAIAYFKTFFRKRRVYNYEMRNLVVAFLFLAMKVENTYTTVEFFKEKLAFIETSRVLRYEMEICRELRYNLHMPSPHLRALGLYLFLKRKRAEDGPLKAEEADDLEQEVECRWRATVDRLNSIMLLETYLDHKINDVALASLDIGKEELEGLFMGYTIEEVERIRREVEQISLPNNEELREINQKIKEVQERYGIAC